MEAVGPMDLVAADPLPKRRGPMSKASKRAKRQGGPMSKATKRAKRPANERRGQKPLSQFIG
eukprot:8913823-Pyramimonas_sp.AAC.1